MLEDGGKIIVGSKEREGRAGKLLKRGVTIGSVMLAKLGRRGTMTTLQTKRHF